MFEEYGMSKEEKYKALEVLSRELTKKYNSLIEKFLMRNVEKISFNNMH